MPWTIELRGGDFDRTRGTINRTPEPLLIVWRDGEDQWSSFDLEHPRLVLATAQVYRRVEFSAERRHAIYEVGDTEPGAEQEADDLVAVGASLAHIAQDLGEGWPVSRSEDEMGPARGVYLGAAIGLVLWIVGALPFVIGSGGGVL